MAAPTTAPRPRLTAGEDAAREANNHSTAEDGATAHSAKNALHAGSPEPIKAEPGSESGSYTERPGQPPAPDGLKVESHQVDGNKYAALEAARPSPLPGGSKPVALKVEFSSYDSHDSATLKVEPSLLSTSPSAVKTPTTPLRSSLKRKRTSMDLDSPTSPTKRTVTFSDEVEENEVESTTQKTRKEVVYALEGRLEGDSEAFDVLRAYFGDGKSTDQVTRPPSDQLRLYLTAITSQVGMMHRSCSPLVHSILGSEWLSQDERYVSAYARFLGALVSSQGFWLAEVLRTIVDKFDGRTSSTTPLAPPAAVLRNRIHAALQYILRLVPSGSKILADSSAGRSSLLAARFPHPSESRRAHVFYVGNLMRLTEYAPELQGEVLTLVTERAVKIDVQVQVDFENLADDVGDDVIASLPTHMSDAFEDDASDSESDMEDEDDEHSEAMRLKNITRSMGTLDLLLDQLFMYYSGAFTNPSSAAAVSASRILLSHFRALILPTYRSRHTQFLLFHFMQSSPALVDDFLGTLVSLVLDSTRPRILRQSAATYLASFVARGLHVSAHMTRDVFSFIADQLTALRARYEPTCLGPHPSKYDTYYALLQALLYIFCFRWRDLATPDDSSETLSPPRVPGIASAGDVGTANEADWENVTFPAEVKEALANNVFSPLNPLRLIAPAIAAEFVDTARKLRVLYAHHVLATNTKVSVLGYASGGGSGMNSGNVSGTATPRAGASSGTVTPTARDDPGSAHTLQREDTRICLDGYFPFDPYQLPASKHWVEADYQEWQGLGDDDNEDEDSSDEEDEDLEGSNAADNEIDDDDATSDAEME